jgi:hypothetical protein
MTARSRLSPKTLAIEARKLSRDIDGARWALAELASQAKAERVPGWAEIIGAECRRQPRTVMAWAATVEWSVTINRAWREELPYTFHEVAARYVDRVDESDILHLMNEYAVNPAETIESFRAELAEMAEDTQDGTAVFRTWATKERNRILGWVDRAPTRRAGDCLKLAADALADAQEMEQETA